MATSRIGERDTRVQFYKPFKTDDGQGGFICGDPVLMSTVWAKILKPKFWTGDGHGGIASSITQGITIRKNTDIQLDWMVKYRNTMYKIIHIDDSNSSETTLTCQAVVMNG